MQTWPENGKKTTKKEVGIIIFLYMLSENLSSLTFSKRLGGVEGKLSFQMISVLFQKVYVLYICIKKRTILFKFYSFLLPLISLSNHWIPSQIPLNYFAKLHKLLCKMCFSFDVTNVIPGQQMIETIGYNPQVLQHCSWGGRGSQRFHL